MIEALFAFSCIMAFLSTGFLVIALPVRVMTWIAPFVIRTLAWLWRRWARWRRALRARRARALMEHPLRRLAHESSETIQVLEVSFSEEDPTCLVCRTPINGDRVTCRRCHTPHHRDCWHYVGRCSTYACGERRYVKL